MTFERQRHLPTPMAADSRYHGILENMHDWMERNAEFSRKSETQAHAKTEYHGNLAETLHLFDNNDF
jgi:hypothetical protein